MLALSYSKAGKPVWITRSSCFAPPWQLSGCIFHRPRSPALPESREPLCSLFLVLPPFVPVLRLLLNDQSHRIVDSSSPVLLFLGLETKPPAKYSRLEL